MILYNRNNVKVYLKESQVKLLNELTMSDFTHNKDSNTINVSIPYSQYDKDNDIADTRLLGDPNDILNGQEGSSKYAITLTNLEIYKRLYEYMVEYQNEYGVPSQDMIPNLLKPRNPFMTGLKEYMGEYFNRLTKKFTSSFDGKIPWEQLLMNVQKTYSKWETKFEFIKNTYNRAIGSLYDENGKLIENPKKIPRYRVGTVPGTDLKVISVFKFENFNISDAIKNGRFRQDDMTDRILGYYDRFEADKANGSEVTKPSDYRQKDRKYKGSNDTFTEIPATYDNGITPIIPNNFSYGLDGETRVKYGVNGKNDNGNDYNSVSQFIDKSIMGAAYAIRKERVNPNFIVSVPSSSNFNVYFSRRLSEKIGVPYLKDFFQKNIIGLKIDNAIYDSGIPTSAIQDLECQLVSASLNVITKEISLPIVNFFKKYSSIFERNNENIPLNVIIAFVFDKVYDLVKDYAAKDNALNGDVSSLLISKIRKNGKKHGFYNFDKLANDLENKLNNTLIKNDFNACVGEVLTIIRKRKDEIVNGVKIASLIKLNRSLNDLLMDTEKNLGELHGNNKKDRRAINDKYRKSLERLNKRIRKFVNPSDEFELILNEWSPNIENKRFKATDVKFNVRPYIENAYIIGDDYANKFNHYYNGRFLLFDEDMNSGASLKMTAKALENNGIDDDNIVCLVNAYKLEG